MDVNRFLKDASKYSTIREETWQGPAARAGRKHDALPSVPEASKTESPAVSFPAFTETSSWSRLSTATGSNTLGAAVVRLMQKHLLESVDSMALDQIELMARRS